MDSEPRQLHVVFLPLMALGHMLPMVDMAKLFAQRGVKASIIVTPANASLLQRNISRANESGNHIELQLLKFPSTEAGLPEGCENFGLLTSPEMFDRLKKAVLLLIKPMEQLIRQLQPNCIVSDMFYPWTSDLATELQIPRLVFHGTSFFSLCFANSCARYAPHKNVDSDTEPFVVPGLPHQIETTKSQLPDHYKAQNESGALMELVRESEIKSFGMVVNSFYEMEPAYADHYREVIGLKAWHIGPVSLCNRDATDKAERWNITSIEKAECLRWLDSKQPSSVIYACFGSMSLFNSSQLLEIALGLESSHHPFIWVVRDWERLKETEEEWLPRGFEERIKDKGLIIRGWAPQILILDHPAIGGFVTHCGWNSILEGVTSGVPMITWPLFAEQFNNEKLIVQVAEIGFEIGVGVWTEMGANTNAELVKRDEIAKAVKRLMDGGEEAQKRKNRAKKLGEKAKRAVQEGGSSYIDLELLIDKLREMMVVAYNPTDDVSHVSDGPK